MLFYVCTHRDHTLFQKENQQFPDSDYYVVTNSMEEAVRQVEHLLSKAPDAESAYIERVSLVAPVPGTQLILVDHHAHV